MPKPKVLKLLLILGILTQTTVANTSMGSSSMRNSNANPNGPAYIMNGGLTTGPNGTIIMGGSTYNEANGHDIPLQEGVTRNTPNSQSVDENVNNSNGQ